MRRRTFIAGLGAAAAWPLVARGQQTAMPVIAYLSGRSAESDASMLTGVRRGLNERGYIEGQNLTIEYRFADGRYDRVPELAADLIRQKVAVIMIAGVAPTSPAVADAWRDLGASQIPTVFNMGADPVRVGLVSSMNRPGGNMTGISSLINTLNGKALGLLRELLPAAKTIAVLLDPAEAAFLPDIREAAVQLGVEVRIITTGTIASIEAAFASLEQQPADAMLVPVSPFLLTNAKRIIALAEQHRLPAVYVRREWAVAGGLMSYGYDVADGYRQVGVYAGRILRGEKPADLPVVQPTKFELLMNLKTAKALGLTIPPNLLATADEIIE